MALASASTTAMAASGEVQLIFDRTSHEEVAFVPMQCTVVKRLGAGASGVVHLVQGPGEEMFVKKTINVANHTASQTKHAMAEVSILARLDHPNIIHHKESYLMDEKLEIIMEYVDDGDLEQKIEKQRKVKMYFSEKSIMSVFTQICLGLKHCHDRKVIHRDLKPDNIFISTTGVVKIGDFGFTTVLESTIDKAQTRLGTPFYMAPELCRGEQYDSKVDMWALGCIIYRLCALKQAFPATELAELVAKIQDQSTPKVPKHFSSKMQQIVDLLLEKDPENRPTINQLFELESQLHRHGKALLGPQAYEDEFSHTVLHNFNIDADTDSPNNKEQAYSALLEKYDKKMEEKDNKSAAKSKPEAPPAGEEQQKEILDLRTRFGRLKSKIKKDKEKEAKAGK